MLGILGAPMISEYDERTLAKPDVKSAADKQISIESCVIIVGKNEHAAPKAHLYDMNFVCAARSVMSEAMRAAVCVARCDTETSGANE